MVVVLANTMHVEKLADLHPTDRVIEARSLAAKLDLAEGRYRNRCRQALTGARELLEQRGHGH